MSRLSIGYHVGTLACIVFFALLLRTRTSPQTSLEAMYPDSLEYAHGAIALLRGHYPGEWDGPAWRPHYPPGFSLLLVPAVAIGGLNGAGWVPWISALVLSGIGAALAVRLGGFRAGPLAVLSLLSPAWSQILGIVVLSDVPAATLTLLQVALLALGRGGVAWFLAGVVGGSVIWVRSALALLVLAGLAGVSALPQWRRAACVYTLGASLPILALGLWQWASFGAPWKSSYDTATVVVYHTGVAVPRSAWFDLKYLVNPPAYAEPRFLFSRALPNTVAYCLDLLGVEQGLVLPGIGILGLVGGWYFARERGAPGVVGRFGGGALLATLAIALPYHYQHPRLVLVPATLLSIMGSAIIGRWLSSRATKPSKRSRRNVM